MYQMLTGLAAVRHAGAAPTSTRLDARRAAVTPPRLKNPKIPKAINDIVLRAMAPEIRPTAISARRTCSTTLLAAREPAPRRAGRRDGGTADGRRERGGDPVAPQGARNAAAALLLALPQAAPGRTAKCPFCGEAQ